jgi:hypothetical protein
VFFAVTVLFSAAITVVFVRGSIFSPLRSHGPDIWKEFAACALCVGVWVGAGATALSTLYSPGTLVLFRELGLPLLFAALGVGSLTGATALLYVRAIDWLEVSALEKEASTALQESALKPAKQQKESIDG